MLKKKFLSLIISFALLITVFSVPANAWVQYTKPSQVSGSDYTDNPAFARALDNLFAGDIDLYTDKSRKNEVSMPLGFRLSMSKQYYMYSTSRKTQTYGWTCFIYSNGAFNKLFGEYVHRGDALKNCYIAVGKGASKMTYDLLKNANIIAGAYIRTSPKSDGSYYGEDGHSMIILAYDKTHITYLEGNGDGKGLVRITKRTYAEFNSAQLTGRGRKITHIVQPKEEWFNTLYPNGPECYNYTFSYDANGGTGEQENITVPYNGEFSLFADAFDHYSYDFNGFNILRNTDGKWLCEDGWYEDSQITLSNPRRIVKSGENLKLDESFLPENLSDVSYTAYAVWKEVPYEKCVSAELISTANTRESYPLNSTVSFANSVIEFTFESGKKTQVTVNSTCNSSSSQTFRFNKNNYSFYIDSFVEKQGENLCTVRLNDFEGELTKVTGGEEIVSTGLSGQPSAIWGENAQITLNYSSLQSETVKALKFTVISEDDLVKGQLLTDGGFYIDWEYNVSESETPTVTYSCGTSFALKYGDINLDTEITSVDLALLKIILSSQNSNLYKAFITGDLNADGQVNAVDLAIIKLQLAGLQ